MPGQGAVDGQDAGVISRANRVQTVDRTILAMCTCGFLASVVAASQLSVWPIVSGIDHSNEPDFAKTKAAFIIGLIASAASLTVGLLRLRVNSISRSKSIRLTFVTCLLASFLCLLVAVAVWGDFVNHGDRTANRHYYDDNTVTVESGIFNRLRWSYWLAVVADVFQFLAFLLYIIRSDFKSDELSES